MSFGEPAVVAVARARATDQCDEERQSAHVPPAHRVPGGVGACAHADEKHVQSEQIFMGRSTWPFVIQQSSLVEPRPYLFNL